MEETPSIIFKDTIPSYNEPLILLELPDYKKNTGFVFNLVSTKQLDQFDECIRIKNINNIIKYEKIKEGIGFLNYCIRSVYNSILASAMINNKPLINLSIDLDESNWCFYLKYKHDIKYKKDMLTIKLHNINEAISRKENFKESDLDILKKEFESTITEITEINKQYTDEVQKQEYDINEKYNNKTKLRIVITEIPSDKLPTPKPNINMPTISDNTYEFD